MGVGPTKVLREKVHCRSLSSIHILYNQPLVGGLSANLDPAKWIANLQLAGGSRDDYDDDDMERPETVGAAIEGAATTSTDSARSASLTPTILQQRHGWRQLVRAR